MFVYLYSVQSVGRYACRFFSEARTKSSIEVHEQKGRVSIRPFFGIDIFQEQLHIWDQH